MQFIKIQPESSTLQIINFIGFPEDKIFNDSEYTQLKKFAYLYDKECLRHPHEEEGGEYENVIRGDLLKSTRKDILVYFIYTTFEEKYNGLLKNKDGIWEKDNLKIEKRIEVVALTCNFNIVHYGNYTISLCLSAQKAINRIKKTPSVVDEKEKKWNAERKKRLNKDINDGKNLKKLVSPEIYEEMLKVYNERHTKPETEN